MGRPAASFDRRRQCPKLDAALRKLSNHWITRARERMERKRHRGRRKPPYSVCAAADRQYRAGKQPRDHGLDPEGKPGQARGFFRIDDCQRGRNDWRGRRRIHRKGCQCRLARMNARNSQNSQNAADKNAYSDFCGAGRQGREGTICRSGLCWPGFWRPEKGQEPSLERTFRQDRNKAHGRAPPTTANSLVYSIASG